MYNQNYDVLRSYIYRQIMQVLPGYYPELIDISGRKKALGSTTIGSSSGISYPERNFAIFANTWNTNFSNNLTGYSITIDVGQGDAEPTYTDYNLASPLLSDKVNKTYLSIGPQIPELDDNGNPTGYYHQQITMDFKNILTEDSITVSEYGIFLHNNIGTFLINREVIEPVVIEPNQYTELVFDYKFKVDDYIKLNDYIPLSWEQIVADVNSGNLSDYQSYLGKKKPIIFNIGTTTYYVEMILCALSRYDLSDGSGKSNLTFMSNTGVVSKTNNSSGWGESEFRTYLNSEFIEYLPEVIKDNIKQVKVKCDKGTSQKLTEPIEVDDKIFIPCPEEIGMQPSDWADWSYYYLAGQGENFVDANSKVILGSYLDRQKFYNVGSYYGPTNWFIRSCLNGINYQGRHVFGVTGDGRGIEPINNYANTSLIMFNF